MPVGLVRRNRVVVATVVAVTAVQISPGLLLAERYRLDGRIAAGGMGEVWRATDLVLERPVAVKLLRPGYNEHQDNLARFRAEARHAGSLSHPGITQVYDYREANPPYPPYLVMELVDGPSLARLLDGGPIDARRTMDLIAQAAAALQAAHAAGLVHRDIKPGNLLVSRSGLLKITDFGISHVAGSATLTVPGTLIGTPAYLAPERTAGAPAMPAADLYALGIVAFQCLTGKLPFSGPPLAVALAHQERPLPPLPPSVPAEVAALVADLTAKDPWARPASAGEVAQRAEHLRTALSTIATRQCGKQNRRRAYAVLAAAMAAAAAATGWAMTGMHGPASVHLQPSPPTASRQPSPRVSHPVHPVMPARRTGIASATEAPAKGHQFTASHKSPGPNVIPSGTPTSSGTLTPSGSPTASGTPAPTGTPTPRATPTPTGTPTSTESPTASETPTPSRALTSTGAATPSGASTASGTPTPSGTSTSAPSSSRATVAGPA